MLTEAAQVQLSSGYRVLSYIPRNVPLHKHIHAFAITILRLRDLYEDIIKESTLFRAYIDSRPCYTPIREINVPVARPASYIDITNSPVTWAEFLDSTKGLPPCLSHPLNCSPFNVNPPSTVEYYRALNGLTHVAMKGEIFMADNPERARVDASLTNQRSLMARRLWEQTHKRKPRSIMNLP
eukprot:16449578-Heterocapsa_arctica.AAC.1